MADVVWTRDLYGMFDYVVFYLFQHILYKLGLAWYLYVVKYPAKFLE